MPFSSRRAICHHVYGDTLWWLALINAFAPFLWAPVAIFLVIGLVVRTGPLAWPGAAHSNLFGHLWRPSFPRWPVAHAASPTPLTVMTFNIWGGSLSPRTIQVIQKIIYLILLRSRNCHRGCTEQSKSARPILSLCGFQSRGRKRRVGCVQPLSTHRTVLETSVWV